MPTYPSLRRRQLLQSMLAIGSGAWLPVTAKAAGPTATGVLLNRPIPSSGEALPVIGLRSWITFNVGNDRAARANCTQVMRHFFEAGGRMIDSSPMYGSAQEVIGEGWQQLGKPARLFAADKVWTGSGARGPQQIETSRRHWGVPRFDLLQVHNLLAWKEHLPTLFAMKAAGRLRYVGITTSEGRRHTDILEIMASQPIDFVQVTYNIADREVEQRILPLARERGIAVIANRPFRQGALIEALGRQRLPSWAADIDCTNWAQFLLKFIVSHPAITCAIPATSNVAHVHENMQAGRQRPLARCSAAPAHDLPCRAAVMSEWWTYSLSDFLIGCAANLAVQGGVKSADGKAVLAFDFIAESAAVRCTAG